MNNTATAPHTGTKKPKTNTQNINLDTYSCKQHS